MKTKNLPILVSCCLLSLLIVTQQSCKKEETANQSPTCKITALANGQEITKGETVNVTVNATDSDGSIAEVRFFVDGVSKGSVSSSPFNFSWSTSGENTGNHTLKATVSDNDGGNAADEISVVISDGGSGGDDFDTITDSRDGQTYNIIVIGSQTWFAENLNYEMPNSWWFKDEAANGDVYGRLYTWEAARTACPDGWHLATDQEWKTLEMQLGMSQSDADDTGFRGTSEGTKLKSIGGWKNNGDNTNSSRFTARPGGYRDSSGSGNFFDLGISGDWWTASEFSAPTAWNRTLINSSRKVGRGNYNKEFGFSVRCVKD